MFVFIHDAYLNVTSNVLVSLLTIFLGRIWFRFFLINEDALDPLRNDILALMASLNSKKLSQAYTVSLVESNNKFRNLRLRLSRRNEFEYV